MKIEVQVLGLLRVLLGGWATNRGGRWRMLFRTLPQIRAEAKAGRLRTSVAAFVVVMLGLVLNTWATFWL